MKWSKVKWKSLSHVQLFATVHGTLQARILEWVAIPFSRGSSQPKDRTQVTHIAGRFFTSWATRDVMLRIFMQLMFRTVLSCKTELYTSKTTGGWGQEEKGMTENEMAGWHHRLNGHEFEWTLGVGDGQGGLACCNSWGLKESDTTERLNWNEILIQLNIKLFIKYTLNPIQAGTQGKILKK